MLGAIQGTFDLMRSVAQSTSIEFLRASMVFDFQATTAQIYLLTGVLHEPGKWGQTQIDGG